MKMGKNLYVVEVNDKIFILDAGLKYPTEDLLGVDAVIPDFTYLKENALAFKGYFYHMVMKIILALFLNY